MRLYASIFIASFLLLNPFSAFAEEQYRSNGISPTESSEASMTDGELSLFLRTAFYSKYVFRGVNLYDGMSFQPNVSLFYDLGDFGRLGAGVWAHIPVEDGERIELTEREDLFAPKVDFIEVDPTISYDLTLDIVNIAIGHTWYTDPKDGRQELRNDQMGGMNMGGGGAPMVDPGTVALLSVSRGDTAEWFASVSVDTILNPVFTFVSDYRRFDYEYYTLKLSETFEIPDNDNVTVKPFVTFAYSSGNETPKRGNFDGQAPDASGFYKDNGLVHVDLGITGRIQLNGFAIAPVLTYVFVEDEFAGDDNLVWGGFAIDFDRAL